MNKTGQYTLEEITEWLVIGLLVTVGVLIALWLGGWLMVFLGKLFLAVAALIVVLLKFLIPALIIAGIIYLVVRAFSKPQKAT